jgi:hypothetical protein
MKRVVSATLAIALASSSFALAQSGGTKDPPPGPGGRRSSSDRRSRNIVSRSASEGQGNYGII